MPEVAAYICAHVFDGSRPVLLVSREEDDWQLLCGGEHGPTELPHVVGLNHLLDRDPSLREILSLESNWEAERLAVGTPWRLKQLRNTT
jgi:hypothetical protein